MSKEIKDYLHLYLGCELWEEGNNRGELLGYVNFGGIWNVHTNCSSNEPYWSNISLHKLILRPLNDMTEEEMKELYMYGNYAVISEITKAEFCSHNNNLIEIHYEVKKGTGLSLGVQNVYLNKLSSKQFFYLLSKHFDLFGLIEAGLAIDKTTLK